MADENNIADDTAGTEAPLIPATKKSRAPRRAKPVPELASVSPSKTVKSTRAYRKKGGDLLSDTNTTLVEPSAARKDPKKFGGTPNAKSDKDFVQTSSAAAEMSDLLQLEEENRDRVPASGVA